MRSVWAALLVLGCGSSTPAPDGPEGEHGSTPRCGATCDTVSLRGPLAAASIGEGRVAVAALSADRTPLSGVARVEDGRWDARSLHLEPVDGAATPATWLAMLEDGAGAVLATGAAEGILVHRVDEDGATSTIASIEARGPTRITLEAHQPGWAVAWLDADRIPRVALIDREGNDVPFEETAYEEPMRDIALRVTRPGDLGLVDAAGGEVTEVETSGRQSASSTASGVRVNGTVIDDGRREGDAAHRVGAALELLEVGEGWVVAYQDQTAGALVVATSEGTPRVVGASEGYARGMHIAVARSGDHAFVLDLGARSTPEIEMVPFVTAVPLR